MKRIFSVSIVVVSMCFILVQTGYTQSPSFKTFTNPVIPGDHSDCTLTKIGDDFYTTGSSFNPTPIIYHSTDLIHWEAIAQPVSAAWSGYGDEPKGGCWGAQIVYYNHKYWDFFGRAFVMYFVTADKPEGPWSEPVLMNVPSSVPGFGADNSIFIDSDSSWYLLVKNGQLNNWIVQLGKDGQPAGAIYNLSWLNPAPNYPYSWAEGPVIWKYNDYYYYGFARDVSGGQKVMRSKTLTADQAAWTTPVDMFNEKDPDKSKAIFSGPNHSSAAVMLDDSTSWVMHPVWARANSNEWYGQGRQGLVNQVRYLANNEVVVDYPNNKYFTAPNLPSSGIPWMVPKSDFFTSDKLNPEWSFLGQTANNLWSLTERPGWFRLKPKNAVKSNTIIKTDAEHNYSLITRLDFDAKLTGEEAGLRLMNGMENQFAKIYSTVNTSGHKAICFSYDKTKYEVENNIGNILWLKMVRINHNVSGYYSIDGVSWVQAGNEINISGLGTTSMSDYNGWCGNRQGLYVNGASADFDLYIYRDAYTPILAECPANQYGAFRISSSQSISVLDSIHNNDWALYAGVEFGNSEYPKASDSISFVASSATSGGSIEVWLDSIETGNRIATCNISNTGSWDVFKTFSAKTEKIKGRHDVYLRFIGNSSGRLFQLKWINFIPAFVTKYASSRTSADGGALIVKFNKPIKIPNTPEGFSLLVNNIIQDNITRITSAPNDSLSVIFSLKDTIKKDDLLRLSYIPGNIISTDNMELVQFLDSLVLNSWVGSKPQISQIITSKGGDSLFIKYTKKMGSPDNGVNKLILVVNKSSEMNVVSGSLMNVDSTIYALKLSGKVYYEDTLKLKYTGQDIKSFDDGVLNSFGPTHVINISGGHPIIPTSAKLRKSGKKYVILVLKLDRPFIKTAESQKDFFTIKINGEPATVTAYGGAADSIMISFLPEVVHGDIVTISYAGGTLVTRNNGKMLDILDFPVLNTAPLVTIVESKSQSGIFISPNPVKDWFSVKSESEFNELKIYSIFGMELHAERFAKTRSFTTHDFNLNSGLYILEISGENMTIVSKIMVQ